MRQVLIQLMLDSYCIMYRSEIGTKGFTKMLKSVFSAHRKENHQIMGYPDNTTFMGAIFN